MTTVFSILPTKRCTVPDQDHLRKSEQSNVTKHISENIPVISKASSQLSITCIPNKLKTYYATMNPAKETV